MFLLRGSTAWQIITEILFGTKVKSFLQPQVGTISHYRSWSCSRRILMQNKIGAVRGIKGTSWKFAEYHNTAKFLNVRRWKCKTLPYFPLPETDVRFQVSHRGYEYLEATQIPKEDGHTSNQLTHFSWLQALSPELKVLCFPVECISVSKKYRILGSFPIILLFILAGS